MWREAVPQVDAPASGEHRPPSDEAQRQKARCRRHHEPDVQPDDLEYPGAASHQSDVAPRRQRQRWRLDDPAKRVRMIVRHDDRANVDARARQRDNREGDADERGVKEHGTTRQAARDAQPAITDQPAAVHPAQDHSREHDEDLGRRDQPEPLVRKPAERGCDSRMIDDDAGHREAAQPIDAQVALSLVGVLPPPTKHSSAEGKSRTAWRFRPTSWKSNDFAGSCRADSSVSRGLGKKEMRGRQNLHARSRCSTRLDYSSFLSWLTK